MIALNSGFALKPAQNTPTSSLAAADSLGVEGVPTNALEASRKRLHVDSDRPDVLVKVARLGASSAKASPPPPSASFLSPSRPAPPCVHQPYEEEDLVKAWAHHASLSGTCPLCGREGMSPVLRAGFQ